MRDYRDAKVMAQTLRNVLTEKSLPINHSESLELIAKLFGVRDWNTLSAAIQTAQPDSPKPLARLKKRATLPALPLRDVVVFPNSVLALYVGRDKSARALEEARAHDQAIALITQRNPEVDIPDAADLYQMGVFASVLHSVESPDGGIVVNVRGLQRVAIDQFSAAADFYQATVSPIEESRGNEEATKALARELYREFQAYAETRSGKVVPLRAGRDIDPGQLADTIANRLGLSIEERQALLETTKVEDRLDNVLAKLKQVAA